MSKPRSKPGKKACPFAEFIDKPASEASKKAGEKVRERLGPRATLAAAMYKSILSIREKEIRKHCIQPPDADKKLKQKIWEITGKFFDDAGHKKADDE